MPDRYGRDIELRHLRYFVAIAEEGSFTRAAAERLHTAQPSLSRQIRNLESDLGVSLLTRGARGLELTPAGRVFLDHARLIQLQVAAAVEATRRAATPARTPFAVGFLTGYELEWLPKILEMLRDDIGAIELAIHSASSPELMQGLSSGKIDVAFLRPDTRNPAIALEIVSREPLFVLLPAEHRLAARKTLRLNDLAGEPFISFPMSYAPALRRLIDAALAQSGIALKPAHEAETLPMVISLVLSTGGVSLMPDYALRLLPPSVVGRPLGHPPMIDLAIGYNKANGSKLIKLLLSKANELRRR